MIILFQGLSTKTSLSQRTYDAFYPKPSSDASRDLFELLLWALEASLSTDTGASMDAETVAAK
jgi:hypothetical protein